MNHKSLVSIGSAVLVLTCSWTIAGETQDGFSANPIGTPRIPVSDLNCDGVQERVEIDCAIGVLGLETHDVRIIDGATNRVMSTIRGEEPADMFGVSVVPLDDINHDGVREIAVAAPRAITADGTVGRVYVVSPSTGTTLRICQGRAGEVFGIGLKGRINKDNHIDLVVGVRSCFSSDSSQDALDLAQMSNQAASLIVQGWSKKQRVVASSSLQGFVEASYIDEQAPEEPGALMKGPFRDDDLTGHSEYLSEHSKGGYCFGQCLLCAAGAAAAGFGCAAAGELPCILAFIGWLTWGGMAVPTCCSNCLGCL